MIFKNNSHIIRRILAAVYSIHNIIIWIHISRDLSINIQHNTICILSPYSQCYSIIICIMLFSNCKQKKSLHSNTLLRTFIIIPEVRGKSESQIVQAMRTFVLAVFSVYHPCFYLLKHQTLYLWAKCIPT